MRVPPVQLQVEIAASLCGAERQHFNDPLNGAVIESTPSRKAFGGVTGTHKTHHGL